MRLLTDSEARERDKLVTLLREENLHLKKQIDSLQEQIKSQSTALISFADSFSKFTKQPAQSNSVTREDIARKLRIPQAYIDQIDMQALGVQLNERK